MKEKNKYIIYHGIPCEIIEDYLRPGDGPYLKIRSSEDIDKAYISSFYGRPERAQELKSRFPV